MKTCKSKGYWSSMKKTLAAVSILSTCMSVSYSQAAGVNSGINVIEQALSHPMRSEKEVLLDSAAFLSSLYRGIKPGGMVGVIEHEASIDTAPENSAELHRLNSPFIKQIMQQAGFIFEQQTNILKNSNDDYNKVVWSKGLRRHTDRSVLRFRKPN